VFFVSLQGRVEVRLEWRCRALVGVRGNGEGEEREGEDLP
jgi:hypothetical protein